MDLYRGASIGVVVQYEGGHILCPDYNNAVAIDKAGKEIKKFDRAADSPIDSENHYENFIKAVRSRKTADLHGKVLDGHISSALCHTGNISYRLGKKLSPDSIAEKIKGNAEATDSFNRLAAHLDANGVDIKTEQLSLGEFLKMDPKTERFIGNAEADQLLTREYRAPFIVPEKV
jgi:hypothetical protein